jgi:chromosomal replication initiation ATPase DnaA
MFLIGRYRGSADETRELLWDLRIADADFVHSEITRCLVRNFQNVLFGTDFPSSIGILDSGGAERRIVAMNDWARVLKHTKLRVNPHNFATWFLPTRLKGTEDRRLLVRVPTHLCKKRLTETYGELLQAVLQEVGIPDTQLEFLCSEPEIPAVSPTVRVVFASEEVKPIDVPAEDKRVTIRMIQERVGEHFGVFPADLKLRGSSKAVVFPRQVAMYLVKQLTSASLPKIGREFGGKHHSTVLSAIQRIEARRLTDTDLNQTICKLSDSLQ